MQVNYVYCLAAGGYLWIASWRDGAATVLEHSRISRFLVSVSDGAAQRGSVINGGVWWGFDAGQETFEKNWLSHSPDKAEDAKNCFFSGRTMPR